MKNTHVQAIELIEGSFDSSTWFVLFLCVYWRCAHECLFSCYAFALYMLCMWFHVSKLKSEREGEWGSIISLSEPGDSCKECCWIHSQGVRWWRLSSLNLILVHSEEEIGLLKPGKECAGWRRSLSCKPKQREVEDCCYRKCTESGGFNTWGVVEWLSARNAHKCLWRIRVEKLRRCSTFVISLKQGAGVLCRGKIKQEMQV